MVNWNRRDLLRACLRSIAAQTTRHPFDVVVVDNGSDDGSPEMVLEEFSGGNVFRLQLVRNPANVGFCAANNQGFAASASEFVALLNNDAEADSGWLEALATAFVNRPDVGMAASKILVHEDPPSTARIEDEERARSTTVNMTASKKCCGPMDARPCTAARCSIRSEDLTRTSLHMPTTPNWDCGAASQAGVAFTFPLPWSVITAARRWGCGRVGGWSLLNETACYWRRNSSRGVCYG